MQTAHSLDQVPLEARCNAAALVILSDPSLSVRGRRELVAAALWPSPVRLPAEPPPVMSREEVRAAAVAAYRAREGSYRVVAERFGVNVGTLKTWVNGQSRSPRSRRARQVDQVEARRLYQAGAIDEVKAARRMIAGGATISEIAETLGTDWGTARRWTQGRL